MRREGVLVVLIGVLSIAGVAVAHEGDPGGRGEMSSAMAAIKQKYQAQKEQLHNECKQKMQALEQQEHSEMQAAMKTAHEQKMKEMEDRHQQHMQEMNKRYEEHKQQP